jgi:hypothetical protein
MTTTTLNTSISPAISPPIDAGTALREGYAEVGDVTSHDVEAGDGPLVLLLHGFPEFWYGWRQQIEPDAPVHPPVTGRRPTRAGGSGGYELGSRSGEGGRELPARAHAEFRVNLSQVVLDRAVAEI